MGFVVSLHFPQKFRTGQLGLLSINFNFRNIIFQPGISLCLGEVQMKIYERSLQALLLSSALCGFAAHSLNLAQIRELACRLRAYLFEAYLMGSLLEKGGLWTFGLLVSNQVVCSGQLLDFLDTGYIPTLGTSVILT